MAATFRNQGSNLSALKAQLKGIANDLTSAVPRRDGSLTDPAVDIGLKHPDEDEDHKNRAESFLTTHERRIDILERHLATTIDTLSVPRLSGNRRQQESDEEKKGEDADDEENDSLTIAELAHAMRSLHDVQGRQIRRLQAVLDPDSFHASILAVSTSSSSTSSSTYQAAPNGFPSLLVPPHQQQFESITTLLDSVFEGDYETDEGASLPGSRKGLSEGPCERASSSALSVSTTTPLSWCSSPGVPTSSRTKAKPAIQTVQTEQENLKQADTDDVVSVAGSGKPATKLSSHQRSLLLDGLDTSSSDKLIIGSCDCDDRKQSSHGNVLPNHKESAKGLTDAPNNVPVEKIKDVNTTNSTSYATESTGRKSSHAVAIVIRSAGNAMDGLPHWSEPKHRVGVSSSVGRRSPISLGLASHDATLETNNEKRSTEDDSEIERSVTQQHARLEARRPYGSDTPNGKPEPAIDSLSIFKLKGDVDKAEAESLKHDLDSLSSRDRAKAGPDPTVPMSTQRDSSVHSKLPIEASMVYEVHSSDKSDAESFPQESEIDSPSKDKRAHGSWQHGTWSSRLVAKARKWADSSPSTPRNNSTSSRNGDDKQKHSSDRSSPFAESLADSTSVNYKNDDERLELGEKQQRREDAPCSLSMPSSESSLMLLGDEEEDDMPTFLCSVMTKQQPDKQPIPGGKPYSGSGNSSIHVNDSLERAQVTRHDEQHQFTKPTFHSHTVVATTRQHTSVWHAESSPLLFHELDPQRGRTAAGLIGLDVSVGRDSPLPESGNGSLNLGLTWHDYSVTDSVPSRSRYDGDEVVLLGDKVSSTDRNKSQSVADHWAMNSPLSSPPLKRDFSPYSEVHPSIMASPRQKLLEPSSLPNTEFNIFRGRRLSSSSPCSQGGASSNSALTVSAAKSKLNRLHPIQATEYLSAPRIVQMQVSLEDLSIAIDALNEAMSRSDEPRPKSRFEANTLLVDTYILFDEDGCLDEKSAHEILKSYGFNERKTKGLLMSLCHFRRLHMKQVTQFVTGSEYVKARKNPRGIVFYLPDQ